MKLTDTQQAVEGVRFSIGDHEFVMRNGVPDQVVLDYDGDERLESECRKIRGGRYVHYSDTDLVKLHDGEYALIQDDEIVELHDGDYAYLDDAVELYDNEYALAEDAVELEFGGYALESDTIEATCGTILIAEAVAVFCDESWYCSDGGPDKAERAIADGNEPVGSWMVYHEDDADEECTNVYSVEYGGVLLVHYDYLTETEDEGMCLSGEAVEVRNERDDFEYYRRDNYYLNTDTHGDYFHEQLGTHECCEDTGEWHPIDEVYYNEEDGCYYSEPVTDPSDRSIIHEYHSAPSPEIHAGSSGWLVGYEVEKHNAGGARCRGDSVEVCDLFAGWETDSSCGVEGLTNVYDPVDVTCQATFNQHAEQARSLLASPVGRDCSGHINISHASLSGDEIVRRFREGPAALVYALWRYRLGNTYCSDNRRLTEGIHAAKYSVARVRNNNVMEIRLPNRILNADVLKRRHRLVGYMCQAMARRDQSFIQTYRDSKELLLEMYGGNRANLAKVLQAARAFRIWFKYGEAERCISRWVSSWGQRPHRSRPTES